MALSLDEGVARVAEHVKKGQCILFLGAGVHASPPPGSPYTYGAAQQPPLGGDLSQRLSNNCGYLKDYPKGNPRNLAQVSLYYQYEKKRKALIDEVREAVSTDKVPSPALAALAELNFPLVITTNYDSLFEMALSQHKKTPIKKVYQKSKKAEAEDFPGEATAQTPFYFKIHGDIAEPESVVITDEDYIHFMMRMADGSSHTPVPQTISYRLQKYATLFIGYSLLDYNLRLLFKTLLWRLDESVRPDTYSVDPFPDKLIHEVYGSGHVNFIVEDVWKFVPLLYERLTGKEMPQ